MINNRQKSILILQTTENQTFNFQLLHLTSKKTLKNMNNYHKNKIISTTKKCLSSRSY